MFTPSVGFKNIGGKLVPDDDHKSRNERRQIAREQGKLRGTYAQRLLAQAAKKAS